VSDPKRYTIERAENGFITKPALWAFGGTYIHKTLEEVMAEILDYYEHRTSSGKDDSFGTVTIFRGPSAVGSEERKDGE
jgi:hypothetical protein